jgi:flagellar protein FlbD
MIALSRLNGRTVAVNPDLIVWIDVTPDTTLCLAGGDRIVVKESLDEVVERIIAFQKLVGPTRAPEVLLAASRRAANDGISPSKTSFRAPLLDSPARTTIRTTQPVIRRK